MTDVARLHLPRIKADTRRCLEPDPGQPDPGRRFFGYCSRALGHTGRHASTFGPRRIVLAVWS